MIEAAWRAGKKVAVPKVEGKNMTFYLLEDYGQLRRLFRDSGAGKRGSRRLPRCAYDHAGGRFNPFRKEWDTGEGSMTGIGKKYGAQKSGCCFFFSDSSQSSRRRDGYQSGSDRDKRNLYYRK